MKERDEEKELLNDIHRVIKDKFGTNKRYDEKFSKRGYWDDRHLEGQTSEGGARDEMLEANPDQASNGIYDQVSPTAVKQAELIKEALETLSEQERKALQLLIDGYTYREAQQRLWMKEFTFNALIRRAKKKIKKYVAQNGD